MKTILLITLLFSGLFAIDPDTEADYLIITHTNINGASQWLSDLEEIQTSRGFQVGSIIISDGTSDQDINHIINSAYLTGVPVQYVMLVGSASVQTPSSGDMSGKFGLDLGLRNIFTANATDLNFIPFTIDEDQSGWNEIIDIPTDDLYYPNMDINTDIFIGRIPATSPQDMEQYVSKLSTFYANVYNYKERKSTEILLSQNVDNPWVSVSGLGVDHMETSMIPHIPAQINKEFIRSSEIHPNDPENAWYDDGTKSIPMENAFINGINSGAGIVHYFGTGSESVSLGNFFWQEDVMIGQGSGNPVGSDYNSLTNYDIHPVILGNCCNIGEIQYPFSMLRKNLLQDLMFIPGGIISSISSTIYTNQWGCREFSIEQHDLIYNNDEQVHTLGELSLMSKVRFENRVVGQNWHSRGFVLYGDPSMPIPINQPQTQDITADKLWQGSIVVENDLVIAAGVTLVVKQGTGIFFKEGTGLTVNGNLLFEGSDEFPVVLAAASESSVAKGYWDGLNISENSIVNWNFVEVRDANEIVFQSLSSSESAINNSRFINNNSIKLNGGNVHFEDCYFEYNQYALIVLAMNTPLCNPILQNCEFINNAYGISTVYNSQPIISGTDFIDNYIGLFSTLNSTPNLLASTFDCNGSNNIFTSNNYGVQAMVGGAPWLGIYTPGMEFGSGYNRIYGNSVYNVNNLSGVGHPIYAQKNHWQLDPQDLCESGDPTSTVNGEVIWSPTISSAGRDDGTTPLYFEISGDYIGAIENYISLIEINPDTSYCSWALAGIVRCYENLGTLSELDSLLYQIENEYPGTEANLYSRTFQATQSIKTGDYEIALNIINQINIEHPFGDLFFKHLFEQILISQLQGEDGSMGRISETGRQTLDDMYRYFPGQPIVDLVAEIFKEDSRMNDSDDAMQIPALVEIPSKFMLHLPSPNPFNPITTMMYDIPEERHVSLIVYDVMGHEVTKLVNTNNKAGYHSIQWNATSFASGVYLVKMTSGDFTQTQKVMLVK